jgi:hypothetical protein
MEARAAHILVNLVILSAGRRFASRNVTESKDYNCDALGISVGSSVRNIKLECINGTKEIKMEALEKRINGPSTARLLRKAKQPLRSG